MDLQNLKKYHEELLSFMENNGYCSKEQGCRLISQTIETISDG